MSLYSRSNIATFIYWSFSIPSNNTFDFNANCNFKIQQWIQNNIQFKASVSSIIAALITGKCIVVSDGSFYPNNPSLIAATWVLLYDETILCIGKFISTVHAKLQNAYAAELSGILSSLLSIEFFTISVHTQISINLALDCSAAIDLINDPISHTSLDDNAFDFTYEIRQLAKGSYFQLSTTKIKLHLDEVTQ